MNLTSLVRFFPVFDRDLFRICSPLFPVNGIDPYFTAAVHLGVTARSV